MILIILREIREFRQRNELNIFRKLDFFKENDNFRKWSWDNESDIDPRSW